MKVKEESRKIIGGQGRYEQDRKTSGTIKGDSGMVDRPRKKLYACSEHRTEDFLTWPTETPFDVSSS